jgi:fluoroacetyl-CoA thioesterase
MRNGERSSPLKTKREKQKRVNSFPFNLRGLVKNWLAEPRLDSTMTIPIGTRHEEKALVTSDIATDFLGQENARVLATPHLIGKLEMTARNSVKPLLDDGYDTVGTIVNIQHLAATPMGMNVTFRSEVVSVEERRINFKVEAFDEKEKVAEGTHQRAIINVGRFATKLAAKAASV